MTKYEKLEAEYNALSTPDQQWGWVLAHKEEVKIGFAAATTYATFKNDDECIIFLPNIERSESIVSLLTVLGIEAEGV